MFSSLPSPAMFPGASCSAAHMTGVASRNASAAAAADTSRVASGAARQAAQATWKAA